MRRGTTLIELVVTLAVMGMLAGLAAASIAALRPPKTDERLRDLARARGQAIRSGIAVRVEGTSPVLFLPDGRAVGRGLDPLTGSTVDATR